MPGNIPVRTFDETVQRHQIPHDQFRHRGTSQNRLRFATGCILRQPVQYCKQFFKGAPTARLEPNMTDTSRSGCPINLSLEVLGDKWSLLIIRDMMFGNRRHFRELLTKSEEGISSNILADRLKTLLDEKIITREADPTHKQKGIYSL